MRKKLLIAFASTLLFDTAIAGLLTLVDFYPDFWINFVFSQCIGLSLCSVNALVMCCVSGRRRWLILISAMPVSIVFGVALAAWLIGAGDWSNPLLRTAVVIGLFFGGIGSIPTFLSERIEKLDTEVKQRQLQQSEAERRELEAQLKLLQAQIEPHFLFNTLANVGSLVDSDPAQAKRLLDRLNDWLRIALSRARSDTATLGDELDMLENYLQILQTRFGARLRWKVEADADVRRRPFPPMLLQPLVENAVRHGIEPKLGGGELRIAAAIAQGRLQLSVHDDGEGFAEAPQTGSGLGNVRARLAALYGDAGRLLLEGGTAGGTTATLEIPA